MEEMVRMVMAEAAAGSVVGSVEVDSVGSVAVRAVDARGEVGPVEGGWEAATKAGEGRVAGTKGAVRKAEVKRVVEVERSAEQIDQEKMAEEEKVEEARVKRRVAGVREAVGSVGEDWVVVAKVEENRVEGTREAVAKAEVEKEVEARAEVMVEEKVEAEKEVEEMEAGGMEAEVDGLVAQVGQEKVVEEEQVEVARARRREVEARVGVGSVEVGWAAERAEAAREAGAKVGEERAVVAREGVA